MLWFLSSNIMQNHLFIILKFHSGPKMTKETVKTIENAESCEPDRVIVPVHCTFLMSSIIM